MAKKPRSELVLPISKLIMHVTAGSIQHDERSKVRLTYALSAYQGQGNSGTSKVKMYSGTEAKLTFEKSASY